MRLTWYGHSCFLIEIGSHRLLIDPFLRGNRYAPVTPEQVDCHYILCTHAHSDHLGDAIEIAQRTGALVIAPYELAMYIEARGVRVLDPMPGGSVYLPFGRVKLTPAIHSSALELPDGGNLPLGTPVGFLITSNEGKAVYHAGDTALFSDMSLIGRSGLDLALLPIGDRYTMDASDAVLALDFLRPKWAVPMHFNTFDPIVADPEIFATKARTAGHQVKILKPGEAFEL